MTKSNPVTGYNKAILFSVSAGLLILAAFEIMRNRSNPIIIALFVLIFTFLFLVGFRKLLMPAVILPIQMMAVIGLAFYDKSEFYFLYIILIIVQYMNIKDAGMLRCIMFSIMCNLLYAAVIVFRFTRYNRMNFPVLIQLNTSAFLNFVLVSVLLVIIKKQLLTSGQLNQAIRKIETQTEQLRINAAVSERNRIAREIHDTVGHTLTTASLNIEAAIVMQREHNGDITDQLKIAREQIKKSLEHIRRSVRLLSEDSIPFALHESLSALFAEIRSNTGITIISKFTEVRPKYSEQTEKIIFNAVREGITNAIRHGKCRHITFEETLKNDNGTIIFSLSDDGMGCAEVKPGMGLEAIRRDIDMLGGRLSYKTRESEGFSLNFSLPYKEVL